jgi:hypothetical protein
MPTLLYPLKHISKPHAVRNHTYKASLESLNLIKKIDIISTCLRFNSSWTSLVTRLCKYIKFEMILYSHLELLWININLWLKLLFNPWVVSDKKFFSTHHHPGLSSPSCFVSILFPNSFFSRLQSFFILSDRCLKYCLSSWRRVPALRLFPRQGGRRVSPTIWFRHCS